MEAWKALVKEFGFTPTAMERIKQVSAVTQRLRVPPQWLLLRTLRITPPHLKDPMTFWERIKVCYCSQGNNKWSNRTGSHDPA